MTDTSAEVARRVAERHRAMTAEQRLLVASSMFETARAIVDSSLPKDMPRPERRAALARRLYGAGLPAAAIAAHAAFPGES